MILQVYVDDETHRRLEYCSVQMGRTVEDLAESAVSEAALAATRHMPEPIDWKNNVKTKRITSCSPVDAQEE